jgi:hypothetical protein
MTYEHSPFNRHAGTLTLSFIVAWSVQVHAEVTARDAAAARTLFQEARSLVAEGNAAIACPKLEEAQRLDPGIGTLYNLADCYERTGRTASAWTTFLDAGRLARAARDADREQAARSRAIALEPRLARLKVEVPPASALESLEIETDGTKLNRPLWGSAVPVDPGKHVVVAKARGRRSITWQAEVAAGQTYPLTVPVLEQADATKPAISPAEPAPGRTQRIAGGVVAGVGLVGFGISTALAVVARSKYNDASSYCEGNHCDQPGLDQRKDAVRGGNIATVVGGLGLAALTAGVVIFLTAPPSKPKEAPRAAAAIALHAGFHGLLLRGEWQ